MSVVRKVERSERSKGKLQKGSVFKGLHENQGKNITSPLYSRQKPEGISQQYSVIRDNVERSNSEMNQLVHTSHYAYDENQGKNIMSPLYSRQKPEGISQQYSVIRDNVERSNSEMNQLVHASHYAYDKNILKSSKARKEKEEVKFKNSGSTNDDDIECDVTEHDNDATIRDTDVNKPIARKRYTQKHSFVAKKGFVKSSLRICSQTFTKIAFILAIVISIFGGLRNIKLLERKSPIGTSLSLFSSEPRVALCFRDALILSSL